MVLLVSLPESYSGLVTALKGRQEGDLTIEYVTGKMLDKYQRRTENTELDDKNTEVALQSAAAVPKKGNNNQRINFNKHEKSKTREKRDNKETRICFYCDKQGHLKSDCYSYKKSRRAQVWSLRKLQRQKSVIQVVMFR